jgi:hypothetical protein
MTSEQARKMADELEDLAALLTRKAQAIRLHTYLPGERRADVIPRARQISPFITKGWMPYHED